jgi:hypothetical protein
MRGLVMEHYLTNIVSVQVKLEEENPIGLY